MEFRFGKDPSRFEIVQLASKSAEQRSPNVWALLDRNKTYNLLADYVRLHDEERENFVGDIKLMILTQERLLLLLIDRRVVKPTLDNWSPEALREIAGMRARTQPAAVIVETVEVAEPKYIPIEEDLDRAMINRYHKNYDQSFRDQYRNDKQFAKRFDRLLESGVF